VTSFAGWVD
jgi:hypothetical protein